MLDMPFTVTAAVTVSAEPVRLDEDRPQATTVFPIANGQVAVHHGPQAATTEPFEVGEVICRGLLAHDAQSVLRVGDQIIVTGTLELHAPLDRHHDSPHVLVSIEATHIGISLARTSDL